MSLYRKMDTPHAAGPGVSAEGADAANQVIDNLLNVGDFNETTADHINAAQSFQEALTGNAAPTPELPPLEVTGSTAGAGGLDSTQAQGMDLSGQMDGIMHTVMDIAGKLADPIGFINAICQFLITMFINAGAQFAQALPSIDLYNQAAQAALDTKKLIEP